MGFLRRASTIATSLPVRILVSAVLLAIVAISIDWGTVATALEDAGWGWFALATIIAFVAGVAEVTQFFEESGMDRAVDQVFPRRLLDADVNSDFGKPAEQFRNVYLPSPNHRTTLVILGDGRNNGKDPNAEALEEISHHVRQTVWITPEPKWGWSLGSCDMPLYKPLCDRVEVVRTVDQLAGVAEELTRVRL